MKKAQDLYEDSLRRAASLPEQGDREVLSAQPKLTLALPDYETRRVVIASDELLEEENERLVCIAIEGEAPALSSNCPSCELAAIEAHKKAQP